MYIYQFGPLLHTERIDADEGPVVALFEAFEAVDVDVDADSTEVLHDYVDPGALDRLFSGPQAGRDAGFVVFEIWGVVVQVTRYEVSIYESMSVDTVQDGPG